MIRRFLGKILFVLIIAVTTLVAVVAFIDLAVMPYLVDVPRVQSPDLRGVPLLRAKGRLQALGLRLSIRDSSYHDAVAEGAVLYQSPEAGVGVKKGRRISVGVSMGRRFYAVPDVRSVSLREAQLQLEHAQLRLGEVIFASSDLSPSGAVIKQVPQHGIELPRHSVVDLEISSGSPQQPKRTPNLRGLSIEVVEDTLRKYEMRLGTITSSIDNAVPPGHVLGQNPSAGARVPRLSAINLVLSVVANTASATDTPSSILLEPRP
jgi:serine/threonine-protein kinase